MLGMFDGKIVIVISVDQFMGLVICEFFEVEGVVVIVDMRDFMFFEVFCVFIEESGCFDIFVVNLVVFLMFNMLIEDFDDDIWMFKFDVMVYLFFWLLQVVLLLMKEWCFGKVVVYGSVMGLWSMVKVLVYSMVCVVQVSFVKVVGFEVVLFNVQVNLIVQNYVENLDYYLFEFVVIECFQKYFVCNVLVGCFVMGCEDVQFVLFFVSNQSDFIVGYVLFFSGGWIFNGQCWLVDGFFDGFLMMVELEQCCCDVDIQDYYIDQEEKEVLVFGQVG